MKKRRRRHQGKKEGERYDWKEIYRDSYLGYRTGEKEKMVKDDRQKERNENKDYYIIINGSVFCPPSNLAARVYIGLVRE